MKKETEFIIEDLGDVSLPEDVHRDVERRIEAAEQELASARLQIRWGKDQVRLIKRAAQLMGIPYQTYAKQVLYRQALEDIERIETIKA